jgi:hypothetical protein
VRTLIVALVVAFLAVTLGGSLPGVGGTSGMPERGRDFLARLDAARDVALARLGESPHLSPNPAEGPLPFCEPVSPSQERALNGAVGLMRATPEGLELYAMLEGEGVCIGVAELPYNSAYASARWTPRNGWAESQIQIDASYFTFLYPDVLASILVHEATHLARAIDRTACYYADACTTLPNGVNLEEEVVAHAAEAEWWIAMYGRDGKDWAFASDGAVNRLKAAYLRGDAAFREFVRDSRSSSREGEGIR